MTPYPEALERQLELLRWCASPQARVLSVLNARRVRGQSGAPIGEEGVRRLWLDGLEAGAPYYWSEPMCALLEAAASGLSGWRLRQEDVPTFAGFCWFARSLALDPWVGDARFEADASVALFTDDGLRAFSWHPVTDRRTGHLTVNFVLYTQERGFALPTPTTMLGWPVGQTVEQTIATAVGHDPPTQPRRFEQKIRYLAAALTLLGQTITTTRVAAIDRAARRRLERAGWVHEPVVRVVELRRRVSERDGQDPMPVEWTCRWLVRGHWRQQPCGTGRTDRRPVWVTPHVKGPEGKPLKPTRTTVFAVVR